MRTKIWEQRSMALPPGLQCLTIPGHTSAWLRPPGALLLLSKCFPSSASPHLSSVQSLL